MSNSLAEKLCDDRNREREKAVLRHLDATIAWCRGLDTADTSYATHLEKQRLRMEVRDPLSISRHMGPCTGPARSRSLTLTPHGDPFTHPTGPILTPHGAPPAHPTVHPR